MHLQLRRIAEAQDSALGNCHGLRPRLPRIPRPDGCIHKQSISGLHYLPAPPSQKESRELSVRLWSHARNDAIIPCQCKLPPSEPHSFSSTWSICKTIQARNSPLLWNQAKYTSIATSSQESQTLEERSHRGTLIWKTVRACTANLERITTTEGKRWARRWWPWASFGNTIDAASAPSELSTFSC